VLFDQTPECGANFSGLCSKVQFQYGVVILQCDGASFSSVLPPGGSLAIINAMPKVSRDSFGNCWLL
jgi:hypothetical protein